MLYFIKNENWFTLLGKSLLPAMVAFGVGFFLTFLIKQIIDLLPGVIPGIVFIKDWMNTPNTVMINLLDQLEKNENVFLIFVHFKIFILFFMIIVITPLYEEIIFRGFLQSFFSVIFRRKNLDIFLTSVIFSVFHYESLANMLFSFICGLFLSLQRKKDNSINICIWMHGLINFSSLLSSILYVYFIEKLT